MAMVRAKKLQFRVAYASTEDGEYPARELNTHSPHTRGWQSAKLCAYPQEIVLQFDGLVRLSALQILSNECKIAQKIELFVGTCPRSQLDPPSIQASEFRRLGYLSLDSNEQSQWRARELKDVNLSKSGKDTTAQFLKLVIHQNHINNVNIHGQVGIMAVNALGEEMHPFVQDTDMEGSLGGMSRAIAPPASTAHNVALDVNFDPQSATAVRAMIAAKQRAVEEENYDEAKVLKAAIETLQKLGGQIAKLEARKRDAVQREDYDEAKGIKQQVDVLRNEVAAVQRAAETGQPMSAPSPAQHSAPPAQAHAQAQAQVQQPAQPVVTMSRLAEPAPEEPFTAALTKRAHATSFRLPGVILCFLRRLSSTPEFSPAVSLTRSVCVCVCVCVCACVCACVRACVLHRQQQRHHRLWLNLPGLLRRRSQWLCRSSLATSKFASRLPSLRLHSTRRPRQILVNSSSSSSKPSASRPLLRPSLSAHSCLRCTNRASCLPKVARHRFRHRLALQPTSLSRQVGPRPTVNQFQAYLSRSHSRPRPASKLSPTAWWTYLSLASSSACFPKPGPSARVPAGRSLTPTQSCKATRRRCFVRAATY
jgi:hypothetical protein